jgi:secreted trypsin-like serine protease
MRAGFRWAAAFVAATAVLGTVAVAEAQTPEPPPVAARDVGVARLLPRDGDKAGLPTSTSSIELSPKIIGGTPTPWFGYAWMAALYLGENPQTGLVCGGTMVRSAWLVTAAHCVLGVPNAYSLRVYTGVANLPASYPYFLTPKEIWVDARYDGVSHDIALIRLTDTALPPLEQTIDLATEADAPAWAAGQPVTAIGWGATSEGGALSPDLLRVTMPIVGDADCQGANPTYQSVFVPDLMLCAGKLGVGGVDTCQGDSGGPLFVDRPDAALLVGITSFGIGCGEPDAPGVYTEVAAERDFLNAVIHPGTPQVTAHGQRPEQLDVSWTSSDPWPTPTVGYTVVADPGDHRLDTSTNNATLDGLASGTLYTVTVIAHSKFGDSSSSPVNVSTLSALGTYTGITPGRLVDTRLSRGPLGAGSVLRVPVTSHAGVPPTEVSAVTLNVTATAPEAPGYLTAFPCGSAVPEASTVNYVAGQTVPNAATVPLADDGSICVFTFSTSNVIVDVTGWYSTATGPFGASFAPVTPGRFLDTRDTAKLNDGEVMSVPVVGRMNVPVEATAATLNITATEGDAPGYVTVFPCGTARPDTSTVNFLAGQTVPNAATIAVGANGAVCVYAFSPVHVIIDVTGYSYMSTFGSTTLAPLTPLRVMDTREGLGGGRLDGPSYLPPPFVRVLDLAPVLDVLPGVPASRQAAVLNVTAVDPDSAGFVTVYPCGNVPLSSSLNFEAGQTVANQVTVGVNDFVNLGRHLTTLCVASFVPVDLVVDLSGVYAFQFMAATTN